METAQTRRETRHETRLEARIETRHQQRHLLLALFLVTVGSLFLVMLSTTAQQMLDKADVENPIIVAWVHAGGFVLVLTVTVYFVQRSQRIVVDMQAARKRLQKRRLALSLLLVLIGSLLVVELSDAAHMVFDINNPIITAWVHAGGFVLVLVAIIYVVLR